AVCNERLSEYNYYWRDIYQDGGHAGERMVTYRDVKRAYPDYRFPLGSNGWEPMTRTVNGGSGWATPPKPKPHPTKKQRILAKMRFMTMTTVEFLQQIIDGTVTLTTAFLHCLWFGFSFSSLCFVFRYAQHSRTLFREELARCKPRRVEKEGV